MDGGKDLSHGPQEYSTQMADLHKWLKKDANYTSHFQGPAMYTESQPKQIIDIKL